MNNNNTDFENVSCDFCKSRDHTKILSSKDYYNKIPGLFSAVKCNNCGLVFTNPRPTKKAISNFYPDSAGYYNTQSPEYNTLKQKLIFAVYREYFNYPGKHNLLIKLLIFPLYIYLYRDIKISGIPNYKKNGFLLDIGSSYGAFIHKMKHLGWNVKGIELNEKASKFGKTELNLDIDNTDFDKFNTNKKFDIITLRMVLEHIFSPKKDLEKINKLLNKNGQLIISIPNFEGFEAKYHKKYAYTLQLPTHLTHFTPVTITKYLKQAGFKNIKIYYHKFDRDLIAPFFYMKNDGKDKKFLRLFLYNKFIRKIFVRFFITTMSLLGKTSRITIYAKK